jgi:hypothetical protein
MFEKQSAWTNENLSISTATKLVSHSSFQLMSYETAGELTTVDGRIVGRSRLALHRRKLNRRAMGAWEIFEELDSHSDAAMQVGEALLHDYPFDLEHYFNGSGLLVAEHIEIEPEFRGGSLWRQLYFATLGAAIKPLRKKPVEYFFKAFPLAFVGNVMDENCGEFEKALRSLKLMYSIHLGAKQRELSPEFGCFMRAAVPEGLLDRISATRSANTEQLA